MDPSRRLHTHPRVGHTDAMTGATPNGSYSDPASSTRIRRIVGVYAADGTLRGELTYWLGARLGRAHCSLCDVTHGLVRERAEWRTCRDEFPVPFDTYHRDDQPESIRAEAEGRTPIVVAETDVAIVTLLAPDEIERCAGSPDALAAAITAAIAQRGLSW